MTISLCRTQHVSRRLSADQSKGEHLSQHYKDTFALTQACITRCTSLFAPFIVCQPHPSLKPLRPWTHLHNSTRTRDHLLHIQQRCQADNHPRTATITTCNGNSLTLGKATARRASIIRHTLRHRFLALSSSSDHTQLQRHHLRSQTTPITINGSESQKDTERLPYHKPDYQPIMTGLSCDNTFLVATHTYNTSRRGR